MHCEEAESLLGQLVFDDLEEDKKRELREHVEACAKCRALAGDMRVAAKLLTEGVHAGPEPKLSAERKERLKEKAKEVAARPRRATAAAVQRAVKRTLRIRRIVAAAAVILVLLLVASMMLPAITGITRSKKMVARAGLKSVGEALRSYREDYGDLPPSEKARKAYAPAASEPASGAEAYSWKGRPEADETVQLRAVPLRAPSGGQRREGGAGLLGITDAPRDADTPAREETDSLGRPAKRRRRAAPKAKPEIKHRDIFESEREIPLGEIVEHPVFINEEVEVVDRTATVSTPGGGAGGLAFIAGADEEDRSGPDDDGVAELNGVRASGRRGRVTVPLSPPPPPAEPEPQVVGIPRGGVYAAGTVVFGEVGGVAKAAKEKFDDAGRSVRAGRPVRGPVPKRPAKSQPRTSRPVEVVGEFVDLPVRITGIVRGATVNGRERAVKARLEAARERSVVPMVAVVEGEAPGRPPRDYPRPDLGRPDVPDRRLRTEGKLVRYWRKDKDRKAVAAGEKLKAAKKAYNALDYEGALRLSEAAAKVDPSNAEAKELSRFVSSIVGIRSDMVRVDLEKFAAQKRVKIQESLMELQWAVNGAKRNMAAADKLRASGNEEQAKRFYGKARDKYARAAVIERWMPKQVDLGTEKKEIAEGFKRAIAQYANVMDTNTARGQEDAISDIPLGGTGVVGHLGVGGGAAGCFGFRSGGGRRRAALRGGGSRASESTVENSLRWLVRNQRPDGSWSVRASGGSLRRDADTGLTGLALLSLLGAGHTEKTGEYKHTVRKAVEYLISRQNTDGSMGNNRGGSEHGSGYNHAIAGLALSEAYGMAGVKRTGEAAQKAIDYSVNVHQRPMSGWRYRPRQSADTSVTGWFTMQLKSALIAGLKVDPKGFQGAISFLDSCTKNQGGRRGLVSYRPELEPTPTMTAIGLVMRQLMGWKRGDPLLVGGANYLMENLPEWKPAGDNLYYWLHGTQGMYQMGGDWWKSWNASIRNMLISKQRSTAHNLELDGSWDPVGKWTAKGGRALSTALGALCLEVYYRYLPIYNGGRSTPVPVEQPTPTKKRVAVSGKLVELPTLLARARQSLEKAREKGGALPVEARTLAEKLRNARKAVQAAERAQEVIKWMPYDIDLGDVKAEAAAILAEARKAREDVLATLQSPRMLAARQLQTGRQEEITPEEARQPAAPEAAQQFLVLSDDEAEAIEKRAEETLRRQIEAAREPEAPVAAVVEEFKPDAEEARETEEAPAPVREAAAARPLPPVNPFVMTARDRFSTFAMDVDTASYTIARKYIRGGYRPPARLVRMEEFVNAFDYNYPKRSRDVFDIHSDGMPSPFGKDLQLLKIGVKSRVVGREGRKPAHLVFVIDASGSMERPDRMPLVKYALSLLVGELAPQDIVTVVAYGTQPGLILEGVSASKQDEIVSAIRSLQCGGSTNMIAGLKEGYEQAKRRFRTGAVNRVILCSDGVANVGVSEAEEILKEIEQYRDWGVTLTVAGFGAGSYDDKLLEKLADSGDGHYIFIDSRREARRVFVEELGATLHTVAKDAKIQVEFDPARVRRYRLIGYENRDIADKDFRNDAIDAGEVGSGQSVTALYEIELLHEGARAGEAARDIGTVYVRYRNVETGEVEEVSHRLRAEAVADPRRPKVKIEERPRLYLAACVAEFAEILRGSEHARDGDLAEVERKLRRVVNRLPLDRKVRELLWLVHRAKGLRRAD